MVGCGRRVRPAAAVTWAPGKIEAKARSDLSDDRVEASQHRHAAAAVVARVAAGLPDVICHTQTPPRRADATAKRGLARDR